MAAERAWQPATGLDQVGVCERAGCAREFRPTAPGELFCSSRCAALAGMAARSTAVRPLVVDLQEADPAEADGLVPEPAVEESPVEETSPPARTCAYGPCDKPVLRPDSHVGWYSKFCSREHASLAKADRDTQPPVVKPTRTPKAATNGTADLRRRYFDLLMDKAAAEDPPSEDLLNRIEKLLEGAL